MAQMFSSTVFQFALALAVLGMSSCSGNSNGGGGGSSGGGCAGGECKLTASDAGVNDIFGIGVGVSGTAIVIGAPQDDDNGMTSGSAYVFRKNGVEWDEEQKLLAADGAPADRFGSAVAVDGSVLVVGAPGDDDSGAESGSVYVYRFDGTSSWVQEAKLTAAADGAPDDSFGSAVAVDGDVIVVGAFKDDDPATVDSGAAYVYRFNTGTSAWDFKVKLMASDAADVKFFGGSVAVYHGTGSAGDEDVIVVGAKGDSRTVQLAPGQSALPAVGAAYVFRFDGTNWPEEKKLVAQRDALSGCGETGNPFDGYGQDEFGGSVAVDGTAIVVGADRAEARVKQSVGCGLLKKASDSGYTYVYRHTTMPNVWKFEARLNASDFRSSQDFGRSVGLDGNTIVVGAQGDADNGIDSGAVYLFRFDVVAAIWAQDSKIKPSDGFKGDFFGDSVSVEGTTAVVGAHGSDDALLPFSGSAYAFEF